jgi:acetylornithine deacetylase
MKETAELLCELIRYDSTPGREKNAIEFVAQAFGSVLDEVELAPIPSDIVADPDYSSPIPDLEYRNRYNMRGLLKGQGGGRSLIVNTHADVVPPSEGQESPFTPVVDGGHVYGRGACDAKGQIATLWHALRCLQENNIKLKGDLIVHIVVEEENGGNGTLALVRTGETADAALVMEPTNLRIVTASRGAVWFRITCHGHSGHVGGGSGSASALKAAVAVMEDLECYHERLLRESGDIPLFDEFDDPMPLTFGRLHSGDWPATVPGRAVLEGVLGFLPNKSKEDVIADMRQLLEPESREALSGPDCSLDFTYRHDSHVTPPDAPIVRAMQRAVRSHGGDTSPAALPCSSDTWLYSNQLGIPAILYGPGKLGDAHSNHEVISLAEIEHAAAVLTGFFSEWCTGTSEGRA